MNHKLGLPVYQDLWHHSRAISAINSPLLDFDSYDEKICPFEVARNHGLKIAYRVIPIKSEFSAQEELKTVLYVYAYLPEDEHHFDDAKLLGFIEKSGYVFLSDVVNDNQPYLVTQPKTGFLKDEQVLLSREKVHDIMKKLHAWMLTEEDVLTQEEMAYHARADVVAMSA